MRKMGYRTVALSSGSAKRDLAFKLGAQFYIDTSEESASAGMQRLGGAALIVSTAPNPALVPDLLNGLAAKGTLLLLQRKASC